MTRLKSYAAAAIALFLALAVLGLFASLGLAVVGITVILSLTVTVLAWLVSAVQIKPEANET